ncbi:GTF3C3 [Symbiodinium pilosum]|uniref:GTF3C3 protein n=1 Tax=Symbiodinium pilosum TaxID=2952 RepID=A0A812XV53_SYMPI|nr:GTF3C3 [Symbiodinium pilosum]
MAAEVQNSRIETILRWQPIEGIYYPNFIKESAIRRLQQWEGRAGDVFLVSNFPVRGLQRVLTCLVEGRDNPWEGGLLDKPYYCEAGASKRGVDAYLGEANDWSFRRCFKTHAFPHLFPCRYPFPRHTGDGVPPKVLVLVADPRHAFAVWWQTLGQLEPDVSLELDFGLFLKVVAQQGWTLFGNYVEHATAWAREAELHPDNVRLCIADRLGSLDPEEVREEMHNIADFLMISRDRADRVVDAIFCRPPDASSALSKDRLVDHAVLQGGHIVENTGRNLYQFQDAYHSVDGLVQDIWRQMFVTLCRTGSSCLQEVAQKALQGGASLPPMVKTGAFRGEDAHNAGTCRPCVFNLRAWTALASTVESVETLQRSASTAIWMGMKGPGHAIQANPPRVDLNILNILAEVLIEMREFEKRLGGNSSSSSKDVVLHALDSKAETAKRLKTRFTVQILLSYAMASAIARQKINMLRDLDSLENIDVLFTPPRAGRGPSTIRQVLLKKLHNCPVDIVAMLAVAMCQIPLSAQPESDSAYDANISEDPVYNCALEVVLSHPPESHSDLHLLLVDAMLADEGTTADTVSSRWLRRANVRRWSAEQAHRILNLLEAADVDVDLRERQAMCRWRLGQVEEAAVQLESLLEDPGERTEAELRNMRLSSFDSKQELQRSNALPPPLSAAERKTLYKELHGYRQELSEIIDRALNAAVAAKDVARYDCELDFKRLNARSNSAKESAAPQAVEDAKPTAGEEEPSQAAQGGDASSPQVPPDPGADSILLIKTTKVRAPKADGAPKASSIHRFKRRHMGIQTVEDMFGFEAYLTMVKHGAMIIRAFARSKKESKSREGTVQAAQAVEVCEMILSNRKLVAQRNPVKRRMLRDLAMMSLSVGFEARLWRVVFKHLRSICDRSGSDHVVALCSRLLFTHADIDGIGSGHGHKDRGDAAPWEQEKSRNAAWGHRHTYAAAFTDVRSWALRKLLRRPRAFGLTLLCAHFCIIASQHPQLQKSSLRRTRQTYVN